MSNPEEPYKGVELPIRWWEIHKRIQQLAPQAGQFRKERAKKPMTRYITINLLNWTVEQVRDTYEDAAEAAASDDCLVSCPMSFPSSVRSGDSLTIIAHSRGQPRE